jgi:hypothetical protein
MPSAGWHHHQPVKLIVVHFNVNDFDLFVDQLSYNNRRLSPSLSVNICLRHTSTFIKYGIDIDD